MLARCLRTSLCVALSIAAVALASPACVKPDMPGESGGGGASGNAGGSGGGGGGADCSKETTCGDATSGCVACAEAGSCNTELNACNMSLECRQYGQCIEACAQGDDACVSDCASSSPVGSSKYKGLLDCVICKQCLVQCDGVSAGCGE